MTSKSSAALRALFDCRWPTRCHSSRAAPQSASIFPSASWTRFSPNWQCPAAIACEMISIGKVLLIASRVISPGIRPQARAVSAILSRILCKFCAMLFTGVADWTLCCNGSFVTLPVGILPGTGLCSDKIDQGQGCGAPCSNIFFCHHIFQLSIDDLF
jgi:hypothetical protein